VNAQTIQSDDSVAEPRPPAYGRLSSLDALRGFDMFWIIGGQEIVKGLAQVFPGKLSELAVRQLEHVRWQGLHFYDVIWPLFMFMVGVSLSFSLARRKLSGATGKVIYLHALKRALILFVLGMMAQGNLLQFNLATLHPCYSVLPCPGKVRVR
jgi:predicted acyltransferase